MKPPFTNRFGTKPGASYKQCKGLTKFGVRCRRCAHKGSDHCEQHEVKKP